MAYSLKQLQHRNILKKAFNRYISLGKELSESQQFQAESKFIESLGLSYGEKLTSNKINSAISKIENMKDPQRFYNVLKNFKTPRELLNDVSRETTGKGYNPANKQQKEQLKKEIEKRLDVSDWIQENLDNIYEFEKRYGNVLTGNNKMSYDELYKLHDNVEKMKNENEQIELIENEIDDILFQIRFLSSQEETEENKKQIEELQKVLNRLREELYKILPFE